MLKVGAAIASVAIGFAAITTSSSALADDDGGVPVVRLALGPTLHFEPEPEGITPYLTGDVDVGVLLLLDGLLLDPELGYTFDTADNHLFNLTFGVGLGAYMAGVTYNPRLLAGTASGEATVGMRNGLTGHFLLGIFSVEIAHQFLHYNDEIHQEGRIMFGINPAAVAFFFLVFGNMR